MIVALMIYNLFLFMCGCFIGSIYLKVKHYILAVVAFVVGLVCLGTSIWCYCLL